MILNYAMLAHRGFLIITLISKNILITNIEWFYYYFFAIFDCLTLHSVRCLKSSIFIICILFPSGNISEQI